jgi:hypothetical protein
MRSARVDLKLILLTMSSLTATTIPVKQGEHDGRKLVRMVQMAIAIRPNSIEIEAIGRLPCKILRTIRACKESCVRNAVWA